MSSQGKKLWRVALVLAGVLVALSIVLAVSPLKRFAESAWDFAGVVVLGATAKTSIPDLKELMKLQYGWLHISARIWDGEDVAGLLVATRVGAFVMLGACVYMGFRALGK